MIARSADQMSRAPIVTVALQDVPIARKLSCSSRRFMTSARSGASGT